MDFIKKMVEKQGPEESDYQALHAEIQRLGALLEQSSSGIEYNDLLDIISPVLSTETMQGFAFHKPHGYSGDYEIIDRIYRKWKSRKPDYIRWDDFFHEQEATKAVRNRKQFFLDILKKMSSDGKKLHVLNVGSGPGRDMYEFFEQHPDADVTFDCIDYDPDAVDYARKLCSAYLDRIEFHQKNVFRLGLERKYDLIWSAGVFDYLDDRQFIFLLRKLQECTSPEGLLVVGNFSRKNPTRNYMELFGKWFLFHRSEDELFSLATQAGVDENHISITSEPLGVNLFLLIR